MKKILLSSDCNGNYSKIFAKVADLHTKNNFDFMLMTGNVCPSSASSEMKSLIEGDIQIPLPVYFIDSSDMGGVLASVHPEGAELAQNFHYLGRMGVKDIQGVKVAYIAGRGSALNVENAEYKGKWYSRHEYKALITRLNEDKIHPDILLSNLWPCEFQSDLGEGVDKQNKTHLSISQLCYELCPRYHVASGGNKYLRLPPFRSKQNWPTHFINVAQIEKELPKDKYLVAIQLNPSQKQQCPKQISPNPFVKVTPTATGQLQGWGDAQNLGETNKNINPSLLVANSREKNSVSSQKQVVTKNSYILFEGFPDQTIDSEITDFMERWGQLKQIEVFKRSKGKYRSGMAKFKNVQDAEVCLQDSGKYTLYQCRIKFALRSQSDRFRVEDCFLCMGKPHFDSSLSIHLGKLAYLCVDKGPIVQNHFQIVPINHIPSFNELASEQKQQISHFKTIASSIFSDNGYTLITYERYMNLSYEINHCIIHCVPVKVPSQKIISAFIDANVSGRYGFVEEQKDKRAQGSQQKQKRMEYYIRFTISTAEGAEKVFVKELHRKEKSFELGRQIVCEILECPERLNWRDCQRQGEQLAKSVQSIRQLLQF